MSSEIEELRRKLAQAQNAINTLVRTQVAQGLATQAYRRVPSAPEVEPDVPEPEPEVPLTDEPDVELSPSTETALPPTVTGTPASASTCVPPAIESDPLVVPDGADDPLPEVPASDVNDDEDDESPTTLIALPETVTGALTSPTTWLPPRMPSSPEVLALPASRLTTPNKRPMPS